MQILREGNKNYVYGGKFTGTVQLEMMVESGERSELDVARIHHEDGAVTHWHSHPNGQVLMMLSGVGRVGSEGTVETGILPGTIVYTQPNERHWHGADEGQNCVWFSTVRGVTEWTDESPI